MMCVICKENKGTQRIRDGNPAYKGKPVCVLCNKARKLLLETK